MPAVASGTVAVTERRLHRLVHVCCAPGEGLPCVPSCAIRNQQRWHLSLPAPLSGWPCVTASCSRRAATTTRSPCAAIATRRWLKSWITPTRTRLSPGGARRMCASCRKAGIQRLVMTSSVAAVQAPLGSPTPTFTGGRLEWWSTITSDAYGYAKVQQEALWASLEAEPRRSTRRALPSVVLGPRSPSNTRKAHRLRAGALRQFAQQFQHLVRRRARRCGGSGRRLPPGQARARSSPATKVR